jgi:hypothetical protein
VSVTPVAGADIDHEHPDDIDENSDIKQVKQWLGDQMGEAHVNCTEGITVGNIDLCAELESGNYSSLLDRYGAIDVGTTDADGDPATEQFNETRHDQQQLADLRAEFDETRREYEAARRAGNEAEARARARELQRLADRIDAVGGDVAQELIALDQFTSLDLTAAAVDINETVEETQTVRQTVENETFTETRLTATANDTVATFAEPTPVFGRLVTENGTTLSNARIVIDDGTQTFETRTNETGAYRLPYRPVRTDRGDTNLSVTYQPASTAPYLGSEASASVTVAGTNATLQSVSAPNQVEFVTPSLITGGVRAAGRPVPNVTVAVSLDGQRLTTARTGADGEFTVSTALPPTVPTGSAAFLVRAGAAGSAIPPTRQTRTVIVTETSMTLEGEAILVDEQLRIEGQLRPTAESDREIGTRPLAFAFGTETRSATTDADGSFSFTTSVDAAPETVTVSYNENGTNLAATERQLAVRNETAAQVSGQTQGTAPWSWNAVSTFLQQNPLRAGAIALSAVAALAGIGALGRQLIGPPEWANRAPGPESGASTERPDDDLLTETEAGSGATTEQLLASARERLESDPDGAVRTSYAAVRAAVPRSGTETQTHREFYREHRKAVDDPAADSLDRLTSIFERAAFAPTAVSRDEAATAVDAAARILESGPEPTGE